MSGRTYAVTFGPTAIPAAGARDLFEITPASNKPVEILGIELGQTSDSGDAQDEQLQISVIRGHTTSGTGGTQNTSAVAPLNPDDAAAGFTADTLNTTPATVGTPTTLHTTAWNVRAGYINWFPEEARPRATSADTTILVRQTGPDDEITMSGTLYVREL